MTEFVYRSNYECVRYLVHGLALFLVVLVLGHMSDFQHHGSWLALIFAVVLVPLFYSIGHIVVDLRSGYQLLNSPSRICVKSVLSTNT